MGMCIVFRTGDGSAEQGFGRRVPVALALLLAAEGDRQPLRRAARDLDWGAFLPSRGDQRIATTAALENLIEGRSRSEPLALSAIWGGPPARSDSNGLARLTAEMVETIALELEHHEEAELRAAFARERQHVGSVLDEKAAVECFQLLRDFFASAAKAGHDVTIGWEYR
jgi:hypothetical protein